MLVKVNDSDSMWLFCKKCNTGFRPGKSCKCGGVQTQTDKSGVTQIIADDSDSLVYDNGQ